MSSTSDLDLGPLSWVKGEIDVAIDQAQEFLNRARQEGAFAENLRFAQNHIHQIQGALSLVGLDGVSQFAEAIDKFVSHLAVLQDEPSKEELDRLSRALYSLQNYLNDLIAGIPHQALRLYPMYSELNQARNAEPSQPSELFFPDLSIRPPQSEPSQVDSTQASQDLRSLRTHFEKGLLNWIRSPNSNTGPHEMLGAVRRIEKLQAAPSTRAFWWAAVSFFEGLEQGVIPADRNSQRLCRRIDTQMRRILEGSAVVADRLVRDVLYYVASAPIESSHTRKVRHLYRLDTLIPATHARVLESSSKSSQREIREALENAKEAWNRFSAGAQNGLPMFSEGLTRVAELIQPLMRTDLNRLLTQLTEIVSWLQQDPSRRSEALAMEVATALLLIENATNGSAIDHELFEQQVFQLCSHIAARQRGENPPPLDTSLFGEASKKAQEKLLINQLAREVLTNLGQVEQALDQFFRNNTRRDSLRELAAPLKQIEGAFLMLGETRASNLVHDNAQRIAALAEEIEAPSSATCEDIAYQLSALGFFVEALRTGPAKLSSFIKLDGADEETNEIETLEEDLQRQNREIQGLISALQNNPDDTAIRRELEHKLETMREGAHLVADSQLEQQAREALASLRKGETNAQDLQQALADNSTPAMPELSAETNRLLDASSEEIDAELLAIFIEEAHDVLATLHEHIGLASNEPHNQEHLITSRRAFHTLKGSSRMVGLREFSEASRSVENTMNRWLQLERPADESILSLMQLGQETFAAWVQQLESNGTLTYEASPLIALAEKILADLDQRHPDEFSNLSVVAASSALGATIPPATESPDLAPQPQVAEEQEVTNFSSEPTIDEVEEVSVAEAEVPSEPIEASLTDSRLDLAPFQIEALDGGDRIEASLEETRFDMPMLAALGIAEEIENEQALEETNLNLPLPSIEEQALEVETSSADLPLESIVASLEPLPSSEITNQENTSLADERENIPADLPALNVEINTPSDLDTASDIGLQDDDAPLHEGPPLDSSALNQIAADLNAITLEPATVDLDEEELNIEQQADHDIEAELQLDEISEGTDQPIFNPYETAEQITEEPAPPLSTIASIDSENRGDVSPSQSSWPQASNHDITMPDAYADAVAQPEAMPPEAVDDELVQPEPFFDTPVAVEEEPAEIDLAASSVLPFMEPSEFSITPPPSHMQDTTLNLDPNQENESTEVYHTEEEQLLSIEEEDEDGLGDSLISLAPPVYEPVIEAPPSAEVMESSTSPEVVEPDTVSLGNNTLSRGLFDLFTNEARTHLATLKNAFSRMAEHPMHVPDDDVVRAAHTLAGICGTARVDPMRTPAKALEHALERFQLEDQAPDRNQLDVFESAAATLENMLRDVQDLRMPLDTPALVDQLDHLKPSKSKELEALVPNIEADLIRNASMSALSTKTQEAPRQLLDEIDEQLLPIFFEEADEIIVSVGNLLRNLRNDLSDKESAQSLARHLHTLKGSARMTGAMSLGEHIHALESKLEESLNAASFSTELVDELESGMDQFGNMLNALREGPSEETQNNSSAEAETSTRSPGLPAGWHTEEVVTAAEADSTQASRTNMRVRADLIDRFVNDAGEISIARTRIEGEMRTLRRSLLDLTENVIRLRNQLREVEIQAESQMQSRIAAAEALDAEFDPLEFDRFTRLQELTRMMAESVGDVTTIQQNLLRNLDSAETSLHAQGRLSRDLQQSLMNVRMVPFNDAADRLYRVVRQSAKELGKRANLDIRGGHIEIDRSVLDKMIAPIEHILRNALAHGIESPDDRESNGKTQIGQITLTLTQQSNEILLEIADDGQGLNYERILARGRKLGLVGESERPEDHQLTRLIFEPGFSTASEVSELAGRGVGMDVVKNETVAVGGRIDIASTFGRGARFMIHLPLTLAVTQALLVRSAGHTYAVPSNMVQQAIEIKPEELDEMRQAGEAQWKNASFPFCYLPRLLGDIHTQPEVRRYNWVLLLRAGDQALALHVDELRSNQEIVVKNAGPQFSRLLGFSGATILPDGEIALILNPIALASRGPIADASGASGANTQHNIVEHVTENYRPLIMVVDDSLTVRKITTRLLEREGYRVVTAKDGVDALEQLVDQVPDVMLLDIEMPRMDGFDLARNIRADSRIKDLPIIMITSRTADKHRNYAKEIGVNHYLGKPYQEEELLQLIDNFVHAAESMHS